MSFGENIQDIKKLTRHIQSIDIDLSTEKTNQAFHISGNFIYFTYAPNESDYITIRFNSVGQNPIKLYRQMGLQIPFAEFYLSIPAGLTGTGTIWYGYTDQELFEIIDHRTATLAHLAEIKEQLQGVASFQSYDDQAIGTSQAEVFAANTDRHAVIIQAAEANTGKIFLGFDNTVATGKYFAELQAGQAFSLDDYTGAIHAISDTAAQTIGKGEW